MFHPALAPPHALRDVPEVTLNQAARNASLEPKLMSQPLGNQRSVQLTRRSPAWRLRSNAVTGN